MDTELLKTFLEVRRTRHFGKAGDNLHLTQAAVSARIRQLEGLLGVTLFTRYRNNIQLTRAGERLVPHAEAVLLAWTRATHDIALSGEQNIELHIATTPGIWDIFLYEKLPRLYDHLDNVAFRAEVHSDSVLGRMLIDRTLDLALLFEPPKTDEIMSVEVSTLELIMVCSEEGASVGDVFDRQYAYVDWGTRFNIFHANQFSEVAPPVLRTTLSKVALEFILSQGGASYLASPMIQPYLQKSLFEVEGSERMARSIYVLYNKRNEKTDLILKLADALHQLAFVESP